MSDVCTFKRYRKTAHTAARPLTQEDFRERGGIIETAEGPRSFAVGDYLARDAKGEWPISRAKIEHDYALISHNDGWGSYTPLSTREAAQMTEPFEVNGLYGAAGDYLVRANGCQWPIDREIFEASYVEALDLELKHA